MAITPNKVRVERAAVFLDKWDKKNKSPIKWFDKVDVSTLNMVSDRQCILYQVVGNYEDGREQMKQLGWPGIDEYKVEEESSYNSHAFCSCLAEWVDYIYQRRGIPLQPQISKTLIILNDVPYLVQMGVDLCIVKEGATTNELEALQFGLSYNKRQ